MGTLIIYFELDSILSIPPPPPLESRAVPAIVERRISKLATSALILNADHSITDAGDAGEMLRRSLCEYIAGRIACGVRPYLYLPAADELQIPVHVRTGNAGAVPLSCVPAEITSDLPLILEVITDQESVMRNAALDHFGRLMIERVRDTAIHDWEHIVDGHMRSERAKRVFESMKAFNTEQRQLVRSLIPQIVDTTLHFCMWTLEQEESIDVAVHTETGTVPSIREISDGLAGDLCDWIPRFSKKAFYQDESTDVERRFLEAALDDKDVTPEIAANIRKRLGELGPSTKPTEEDRALSDVEREYLESELRDESITPARAERLHRILERDATMRRRNGNK